MTRFEDLRVAETLQHALSNPTQAHSPAPKIYTHNIPIKKKIARNFPEKPHDFSSRSIHHIPVRCRKMRF